jgi:hypothetical protein
MAEDQLNCGSIPVRGSQAVECDRTVCWVDMCSDRFCGVCNLSTARACHNVPYVLHMACMLAGVSFLLHVAACMQRRAALRFGVYEVIEALGNVGDSAEFWLMNPKSHPMYLCIPRDPRTLQLCRLLRIQMQIPTLTQDYQVHCESCSDRICDVATHVVSCRSRGLLVGRGPEARGALRGRCLHISEDR